MSLIGCGSIHQGHERFSDDSRGRRDLNVLGCSIMWAILPIREWRCQAIDQVLLHEIIFEVLGKITSIRSKLPTAAYWSRERKRGNCEANLLYLALCRKRLRYSKHHWQPNLSQYSPVEALNLIVDSKSQPVELDNSTIGSYMCRRGERKACD